MQREEALSGTSVNKASRRATDCKRREAQGLTVPLYYVPGCHARTRSAGQCAHRGKENDGDRGERRSRESTRNLRGCEDAFD